MMGEEGAAPRSLLGLDARGGATRARGEQLCEAQPQKGPALRVEPGAAPVERARIKASVSPSHSRVVLLKPSLERESFSPRGFELHKTGDAVVFPPTHSFSICVSFSPFVTAARFKHILLGYDTIRSNALAARVPIGSPKTLSTVHTRATFSLNPVVPTHQT